MRDEADTHDVGYVELDTGQGSVARALIDKVVQESAARDTLMRETVEVLATFSRQRMAKLEARLADFERRLEELEKK